MNNSSASQNQYSGVCNCKTEWLKKYCICKYNGAKCNQHCLCVRKGYCKNVDNPDTNNNGEEIANNNENSINEEAKIEQFENHESGLYSSFQFLLYLY